MFVDVNSKIANNKADHHNHFNSATADYHNQLFSSLLFKLGSGNSSSSTPMTMMPPTTATTGAAASSLDLYKNLFNQNRTLFSSILPHTASASTANLSSSFQSLQHYYMSLNSLVSTAAAAAAASNSISKPTSPEQRDYLLATITQSPSSLQSTIQSKETSI
jgi:hypothetical protein